jgi:hypothetical protein
MQRHLTRTTERVKLTVNLTITPLIRIAALAGLILVVAIGGAALVLGRSHSTTPAASGQRHGSATPAKRTSPVHAKKHVTAPSAAHIKSKTAVKTAVPATHAKKTVHKAVHKTATPQKTSAKHKTATHKTATHKTATHKAAKTTFRGNPVYADLPAQLQWQLAHNKVVVVSFYNPNANVDAISVAEAHAGATAAKVGFLLVSVLDNKVAGILTALLPAGGLLPEPGVLIYRAPGTIALRIDGFADRDSIAQAATNAVTFPAATTAAALTPATP